MSHRTAPPHYHTLGVEASISASDLARQYKKLSLALHPDRAAYRNATRQEEEQTQQRYQQITEAYRVLSDPDKRKAYDTQQGVNLKSRAAAVHDRISAHNTHAQHREGTESSVVTNTPETEVQGAHGKRGRGVEGREEESEEEEEEEYEPQRAHSTAAPHSARDGKPLFILRPHRSTHGHYMAHPRLRTCTLTREALTASWGVSISTPENHLVDFDKMRYAALPCPARVLTVAGLPLREGTDTAVGLLQHSLADQLSVTLQLEYYVDEWELVGDLHLLRDEAVLRQLVPLESMAPVLVLPRSRSSAHEAEEVVVVSVNGEAVLSSTALRQALQKNAASQIQLELSHVPVVEKRSSTAAQRKKTKMNIYN